jgi:hypothetical protein
MKWKQFGNKVAQYETCGTPYYGNEFLYLSFRRGPTFSATGLTNSVVKVDSTGDFIVDFPNIRVDGNNQNSNIITDEQGVLYILAGDESLNGILNKYQGTTLLPGSNLNISTAGVGPVFINPLDCVLDVNDTHFVIAGNGRFSPNFTNQYFLKKYAKDNTLIFNITVSNTLPSLGITFDKSENIIVTSSRLNNITHRKFDSSGTLLWARDHINEIWSVAVDANDNVYIGGFRSSSVQLTHRKYDKDGTLLWSANAGNHVFHLATDIKGNVVVVFDRGGPGLPVSLDVTTRKYDTNGNLLWSRDNIARGGALAVAIDKLGNVYTNGNNHTATAGPVLTQSTKKYDKDGTLLWSVDFSGDTGFAGFQAQQGGIALYPPNRGPFLSGI